MSVLCLFVAGYIYPLECLEVPAITVHMKIGKHIRVCTLSNRGLFPLVLIRGLFPLALIRGLFPLTPSRGLMPNTDNFANTVLER